MVDRAKDALVIDRLLNDELRLVSAEAREALGWRYGLIDGESSTFVKIGQRMSFSPTTARRRVLEGLEAFRQTSIRAATS